MSSPYDPSGSPVNDPQVGSQTLYRPPQQAAPGVFTPAEIESHVKILGILHAVYGGLFMLIGVVIFLMFGGVAVLAGTSGEQGSGQAAGVMVVVAVICGLVFAVLALPQIAGGVGLMRRRNWARAVIIVLAILSIANFPFGTALGAYTLWVLFKPEVAEQFT